MASPSADDRVYIAASASERDKIDKALRLPGLHFQKNRPVLGKKQGALMIALAAFDIKRNRPGNQLVVVRRLCILYDALLNIHKDHPALDINGDAFYEAALDSISKTHKEDIAKYLTPASLHHVIELYRKAFHYGGLKPKRTDPKKNNGAQDAALVQRDASQPNFGWPSLAQPNGNGGETFIGEKLMWPSESVKHKGGRVKLQGLVEEWIIALAVERRKKATAKELQTIDPHYAEQPQGEPTETYKLVLQPTSEYHGEKRKSREEGSTELLEEEKEALEEKGMLEEYKMLERQNEVLEREKQGLKNALEERDQLIRQNRQDMKQLSVVNWLHGATAQSPDINTTDQPLNEIDDSLVQTDDQPGRNFPGGSQALNGACGF